MFMKSIIVVPVILTGLIAIGCVRSNEANEGEYWSESGEDIDARRVILFLGDSLTAGYHLDPAQAFPALIQEKVDAAGLPWRVVNAGVSGDTSTDGLNRVDWLLRQDVDMLVLALGANDALRGQPIEMIEGNLSAIFERARSHNPDMQFVLGGMRMPTNYGEDYTLAFADVFPTVAEAYDAVLIPFLLEGVAGIPELNLGDGIHPTTEGHRIIAKTVWEHVEPVLEGSAR